MSDKNVFILKTEYETEYESENESSIHWFNPIHSSIWAITATSQEVHWQEAGMRS